MNEEYIKSVADLMVIKERPHYATGSNFVVVDLSRSGLGEVDLGWGKPIYGGATGALPYFSIYIWSIQKQYRRGRYRLPHLVAPASHGKVSTRGLENDSRV